MKSYSPKEVIDILLENGWYEKRIRELIDIKKPTRELLQTLIDKIEIDKNKNIEIFYRFMI
mgnify:CR=1 FL=1